MEKISYQPLISHLKEHEEYYATLLNQYELNYGVVPGDTIKYWMVTIIQPLIVATSNGDDARVNRINRALFTELLNLMKSQISLKDYERAWQLFKAVPELFSQKPSEVIKVIDDGLRGVLSYQPARGEKWLDIMTSTLSDCDNIPQMKALGKVAAWLSGLAHLREASLKSFENLPEVIKIKLRALSPEDERFEALMEVDWNGKVNDARLGGFVGFTEGIFEHPPIVSVIDNVVMATDDKTVCAIFNDTFGTVILSDINFPSNEVKTATKNPELSPLKKYRDISSSIQINDSLIFTRKSSYYIHISTL